MKAQSNFVFGLTVIVITGILMTRLSLFSFGPLIESRANLAADMSANEYALELAEGYLEPSLKYSFYQGCHDLLLKGGKLSEGTGELAEETEFMDNLEKRTLGYLNIYTGSGGKKYDFLGLSYVVLPEYKSVDITSDNEDVYLKAEAAKELAAKAEHTITKESEEKESVITDTLKKQSALSVQVKSECIELFRAAGKMQIAAETEKAVQEELARWPAGGAFQSGSSISDSADATFREAVKAGSKAGIAAVNTIAEGEAEIKAGLENIAVESVDSGYKTKAKITEASPRIRISSCSTGQQCTFTYSTSVRVEVSVEGKGPPHPVFDGKELAERNMELSYIVLLSIG